VRAVRYLSREGGAPPGLFPAASTSGIRSPTQTPSQTLAAPGASEPNGEESPAKRLNEIYRSLTTLVVASGGGDSSSSTFATPPSSARGSSDPVIVAITPDGAYALVEVTVVEDEAPHHIWVRLDQASGFNVETTGNNIYFRGNPPWVDVMGPFNSTTGAFTATGSGVVAGYNNVSVHFEGTASNDAVSGYVIMGAAGELPGGQYIKYFVRATQTSQ
jgi:hypothetical protein